MEQENKWLNQLWCMNCKHNEYRYSNLMEIKGHILESEYYQLVYLVSNCQISGHRLVPFVVEKGLH